MLKVQFNFRHFLSILAIVSFFVVSFFVFSSKTNAATGINRQINFQGKLVDDDGVNVTDTSYTVVFTIYDRSEAGQGTALWTETQSVTTTDGIFRVALGSVTAFPANFNFNWDGLYLGIKVNSDDEMTPRIRMAAVPYAFNAEKVAGLTVQDENGNASTSGILKVTNGETLSFGGSFTTTAGNDITFTTTGATTLTLPSSGILLTNTASAVQTITSTQTTGTVLGITDTAGLSGAIKGFVITLSGSGAQDQTGLEFNLSNASGTNVNDIVGSGGTWKISRTGALTVASCTGCGGATGTNWWSQAAGILTPFNSTTDLLIGGQATTSAQFAILNIAKNQAVATVAGQMIIMPNNGWGGKVGIGYNDPGTATLAVNGNVGIGIITPDSQLKIVNDRADDNLSQLIIQGIASQTANEFEVRHSSGRIATSIADLGGAGALNVYSDDDADGGSIQLYSSGSGPRIYMGSVTDQDLFATFGAFDNVFNFQANGRPLNFRSDTLSSILYGDNTTGLVGINTTSLLSTLDVRSRNGTLAIASISGQTSFASLVANNDGVGDLFTASMSGWSKFVIQNDGTVRPGDNNKIDLGTANFQWKTIYANTYYSGASAGSTIASASCVVTTGGIVTGSGACPGGTGGGYSPFQELLGAITPNNSTLDFLIGGQASTSARFHVYGNDPLNWRNPAASVSANSAVAAFMIDNAHLTGDLFTASASGATRFVITSQGKVGIGTSNPQAMLDIAGSSSTIANSSGDITITPAGNLILSQGKLGIGTTTPLATLDLRSQNGTLPVASISGKTSFAGLVVDQSGVGDIFTASSSGGTRFRIAENGSVLIQGQVVSSIGAGGTDTTSGAVINAIGDQGSMVPNAGFESRLMGGFADGWAVTATNTATITSDVATQAKGNSSLKVQLTNTKTAIYSTCFPVAGATANSIGYILNWYAKGTAPLPTVRAYLDNFTSKANCMSNTSPTFTFAQGATVTTAWAKYGSNTTKVTIGNTATWAKVRFFIGSGATNAIVNIDGVRVVQTTVGSGTDYAENYPLDPDDTAEPGDVVSMKSNGAVAEVTRTTKYMDDSVIGVVSTDPGDLVGGDVPDPKVPVALSGRVPVKVSSRNGSIHLGDYLTSSDIPGVAVKATMAGPVIGTAMENYLESDSLKIGKITMFIKNTYYNGLYLADNAGLSGTGTDNSVILAMVKDAQNSKNSISLNLTKDGQFVIQDENGKEAIRFDNKGNAFFSGVVVADKIKANQIEGFDIFANRISSLDNSFATLSAAFTSTESAVLGSEAQELPNELTLSNLNVEGLATVSGSLRIKNNLLVEGVINVIDSITTQNVIVSGLANFFGEVIFKNDVSFEKVPNFSKDTAGFAVIKKDQDRVEVVFEKEYTKIPIITAGIVLGKNEDNQAQQALEEKVLTTNIKYVITQRTTKGFVILLNKKTDFDLNFSWVALSVKDPSLSEFMETSTHSP